MAAASLFTALVSVMMQGIAIGETFRVLSYVEAISLPLFFAAGVVCAGLLFALTYVWGSTKPLGTVLLLSYLLFAFLTVCDSESSIFLSLGLSLPLFLILRWVMASDDRLPNLRLSKRDFTLAFAGGLFIAFTALLSYYAILRYRTYYATTFDLGLFAQMFEQLRRTGHAWTTMERNQLLSHFGVHCSPIYYLLLPFYMLVPRVETLLVLQAAAVGAGVFAVRSIARQLFGNSPRIIMAACLMYICNPALGQWCLWDFHENKFLPVLLLWAFYFLLRNKTIPLLMFSGLVLMVKEDAAIYVCALALYYLMQRPWIWSIKKERKRILTGIAMIAMSVVWFVIAISIVRHFGNGVMVDRLRNYFLPNGGKSFVDVIKVCLFDLAYVIKECFSHEKVIFLVWVFLPFGFVPFLQKKGAAWLLLLPMLVINLMPNYGYQYALGYQYTCGSLILALLLALVTLKDLRPNLRRGILIFAVSTSILITIPILGGRFQRYSDTMRINKVRIAAVDQIMEELNALPPEVEITATTWFGVHLYKRDHIYMFPNYHGESRPTEYLLSKPEEAEDNEALQAFILEHGYILEQETAFLQVYRLISAD